MCGAGGGVEIIPSPFVIEYRFMKIIGNRVNIDYQDFKKPINIT